MKSVISKNYKLVLFLFTLKYLITDSGSKFPAAIINEEKSFATQTFYIKFCDQEFDINEMCIFRSNFSVYPFSLPPFFIEVMLCYQNLTDAEKKSKSSKYDSNGFKTLSTITLKVKNLAKGVHEYIPIFFDNFMFSVVHTMIHSTMMNFKFEIRVGVGVFVCSVFFV